MTFMSVFVSLLCYKSIDVTSPCSNMLLEEHFKITSIQKNKTKKNNNKKSDSNILCNKLLKSNKKHS